MYTFGAPQHERSQTLGLPELRVRDTADGCKIHAFISGSLIKFGLRR